MDAKKVAEEGLIFKCISGSRAYQTAGPDSDVDTRGICVAPPELVLSCHQGFDQYEYKPEDLVIYELKKFFKLAVDNNPNIIELLYPHPDDILFIHPLFQKAIDNAHLFLSKKAKHTFSGYAIAQLKRVKGHKKWISNPQPIQPPLLSSFCTFTNSAGVITKGTDEGTVSGSDLIRAISKGLFLVQTFGHTIFRVYKDRNKEFQPGFFNHDETDLKYIDIEESRLHKHNIEYRGMLIVNFDEFRQARTVWKDYWTWKRERNKARAELEEKYSYDTKHVMHLVRLMRMCKEILAEGKVIVKRPDAQELLDIRNGKFDYDYIINWAEQTDAELNDLYEKSSLQNSADVVKIDELYREILFGFWKEKGW